MRVSPDPASPLLTVRLFAGQPRRKNTIDQNYAAQLHAKFGIIDHKEGWCGSFNPTFNSASFFEAIAIIREPTCLSTMSAKFESWWLMQDNEDEGGVMV